MKIPEPAPLSREDAAIREDIQTHLEAQGQSGEEPDDWIILADGFERAFMGTCTRGGVGTMVSLYDTRTCVETLIERDGMTDSGAREFFDFNVRGTKIGPKSPMFFEPLVVDGKPRWVENLPQAQREQRRRSVETAEANAARREASGPNKTTIVTE